MEDTQQSLVEWVRHYQAQDGSLKFPRTLTIILLREIAELEAAVAKKNGNGGGERPSGETSQNGGPTL